MGRGIHKDQERAAGENRRQRVADLTFSHIEDKDDNVTTQFKVIIVIEFSIKAMILFPMHSMSKNTLQHNSEGPKAEEPLNPES